MCVRGSARVKVTPGYKEEQCAPALTLEMKRPVDLEAPISWYLHHLLNPIMHCTFTIRVILNTH